MVIFRGIFRWVWFLSYTCNNRFMVFMIVFRWRVSREVFKGVVIREFVLIFFLLFRIVVIVETVRFKVFAILLSFLFVLNRFNICNFILRVIVFRFFLVFGMIVVLRRFFLGIFVFKM